MFFRIGECVIIIYPCPNDEEMPLSWYQDFVIFFQKSDLNLKEI
jgi:hypothetical protein